MNRREFLSGSTCAATTAGVARYLGLTPNLMKIPQVESLRPDETGSQSAAVALPGTSPLTTRGDIAMQMVDCIHRHLLAQTGQKRTERSLNWDRNNSSTTDYERSVAAKRDRLRRIIGAVDGRIAELAQAREYRFTSDAELARADRYTVRFVEWRVFAPATADSSGMRARGLLLQPNGPPVARVVAIPDADCAPEMLAGIEAGLTPKAQYARQLADNGIQVIVPLIVDRSANFSGIPGVGKTNMPHREWIYRMAFEAGRHIIGYEVQSILAAIDWFGRESADQRVPIGVMGYGEGGLLALCSAAIDTRIQAAVVSGYFEPREIAWQQPIYRDVWSLLNEFGDAELAGLIAPRTLIVEASAFPEVSGPPRAVDGQQQLACPNGTLKTPPLDAVKAEIERARPIFKGLHAEDALQLVAEGGDPGHPGSEPTLRAFLRALDVTGYQLSNTTPASMVAPAYDPSKNMQAQVNELVNFTQSLIRRSPDARREFWSKADTSSIEKWKDSTQFYRDFIWTEVIGRLPSPNMPANPRTRKIFETERFNGYEVMLDVWADVFAYGILLLPKDLKPNERRPVVVCQHGLEGRPTDLVDPKLDHHFYHHFGASLADEGFIVYAPQNPYIGEDKFRIIQRLGHPLKLSLFSYILGQHEQTLKWLSTLPFVDPKRIGFYGLSYGGKTAVRVPPLIDGYALSICSGDFNEWVWKTTTVLAPQSYLLTKEYDMYEFNFAEVVNYSDLANLMVPRPFMVERGHDDPVSVDSEVAFEYAKVREFYDKLSIGDRTEIEFFNGPHEIHGKGTFAFLKKHLNWAG